VTTSNVPFAAIHPGAQPLQVRRIGWGESARRARVYFVLVFLHPYLFGARPYEGALGA